ncbi:MAG: tetratricopeptide repeat protein [Bacteroidota bacterium]
MCKLFSLSTGLFICMLACQPPKDARRNFVEAGTEQVDPTKIYSLIGEELPEKQLSQVDKVAFQENLEIAKAVYESSPDSLDAIIWYGRRLAYLGSYIEAIKVYSDGLKLYPDAYQLYRHRGHRYITTRQLSKAIDDFELAAYYSLNQENRIEPDGKPNRLNQPISNDKFNIWYHFGLAYYLRGRYDKALSAYTKCEEFCDNNDLKVAVNYWQYLTYLKLGNAELAQALLDSVEVDQELVENRSYHDLLMLFKKEKSIEALQMKLPELESGLDPTYGYGMGIFYRMEAENEKANEVFLRVAASQKWDAFGYIAAEAELKTIFPVP